MIIQQNGIVSTMLKMGKQWILLAVKTRTVRYNMPLNIICNQCSGICQRRRVLHYSHLSRIYKINRYILVTCFRTSKPNGNSILFYTMNVIFQIYY